MKFLKDYILTWPFFAYVALAVFCTLITCGALKISSVKAGSFEMVLEKNAQNSGIAETPEFRNLKTLNESDLQLFLIMGGEDAQFYQFTNVALHSNAAVVQYEKLERASLMSIKRISNDSTMVTATVTGKKVHRVLIQSLYTQLMDIED